jgi:hypothetical protein
MTKRAAPVSHFYACRVSFSTMEITKENVDETSRSSMFEIVALSDRPEPARELGVQDQRGLWGRTFFNRIEALRFAMFENGNRPQGVLMVPGAFELDMNRRRSAKPQTAAQGRLGSQATGRLGIGTTENPARSG